MKKVKDIMERPILVKPSASRAELKKLIISHPHTSIFIVTDNKNNFLGTIHEDDLFLMLIPDKYAQKIGAGGINWERKFFARKASELMEKYDLTCDENDSIVDVALMMANEEVDALPVIKDNRVIGIISRGILVRQL